MNCEDGPDLSAIHSPPETPESRDDPLQVDLRLEADDGHLQVDLRLKLDEVAAIEAELLRQNARRQPTRQELTALAGKIYGARRLRDRLFNGDRRNLLGEPAWDMLLAMYYLPKQGEILSVTGLSMAVEVPHTTGLRWQKALIAQGLMERGPQSGNLRWQLVRLTPAGRALMESYLTRLFYSDAPHPAVVEPLAL